MPHDPIATAAAVLTPRRLALALLVTLPLAAVPAFAQQGQDTPRDQQQQSEQKAQQQGEQPDDGLVATVGDTEIRGSDIMMAVGRLPEPLRDQPMEMLLPMALDQLILRELVLQAARKENLADDPEVKSLTAEATEDAEDDAMVLVWLRRELNERVDDKAVQQVYDDLKAKSAQELPPLDDIRPQIEQHLRQQAFTDLRTELQEDTKVTFYGPDGQPLERQE